MVRESMRKYTLEEQAFYDMFFRDRPILQHDRICFELPDRIWKNEAKLGKFKKKYNPRYDGDDEYWYTGIFNEMLPVMLKEHRYHLSKKFTTGEAMARMKIVLELEDAGLIEKVLAVDEVYPERAREDIHEWWEEDQRKREEMYQ